MCRVMCIGVRALEGVKHRVCSVRSSGSFPKLGGWDGKSMTRRAMCWCKQILLCWAALFRTKVDHQESIGSRNDGCLSRAQFPSKLTLRPAQGEALLARKDGRSLAQGWLSVSKCCEPELSVANRQSFCVVFGRCSPAPPVRISWHSGVSDGCKKHNVFGNHFSWH